jgi:uncharacterized phage protein (TIGR02220 family)
MNFPVERKGIQEGFLILITMSLINILSQDAFWIVNKQLAKKTGLHAALILSDIYTKMEYFKKHGELDDDGFFFNTSENIEEDTTLSYHLQKKAFKILKDEGFIETKLKGVPAKTYYKVVENKILKFLNTGFENNSKLDVENFNTNNNKPNNNKTNNKGIVEKNLFNIPLKDQKKEKEKPTKEKSNEIDFDKLLMYLNNKTGKKMRVVNKSVQQSFKARLKDGYKPIDIRNAIDNAIKTQYHKENNYQYLTIEFFSRSSTIDKYGFISNKQTNPVTSEILKDARLNGQHVNH